MTSKREKVTLLALTPNMHARRMQSLTDKLEYLIITDVSLLFMLFDVSLVTSPLKSFYFKVVKQIYQILYQK